MSEAVSENHRSVMAYIQGYFLSLVFTLLAFFLVQDHVNSGHSSHSHRSLMFSVLLLAVSQLFVQLYYFLHVGKESRPKWNAITLLFALMVVIIIVAGSLWIMKNLNYNTMPAQDINEQIIHDEGYHSE